MNGLRTRQEGGTLMIRPVRAGRLAMNGRPPFVRGLPKEEWPVGLLRANGNHCMWCLHGANKPATPCNRSGNRSDANILIPVKK